MRNSYTPKEKIILNQIGKRIRFFRLKTGLSQEKLAFACDLDRTYIGSVERGERNIAVINLCKISSALKIDSYQLLKTEE